MNRPSHRGCDRVCAAPGITRRLLASTDLGVKAGQMFEPIRVAVCGRKTAPPLFGTLEVLGRETCLRRIEHALANLGSASAAPLN